MCLSMAARPALPRSAQVFRLVAMMAWLAVAQAATGQPAPKPPDAIERLRARPEQAPAGGGGAGPLALAAPRDTDAPSFDEFASAAGENPTRVVVKERDRLPLDNGKLEVLLEVFVERGQ